MYLFLSEVVLHVSFAQLMFTAADIVYMRSLACRQQVAIRTAVRAWVSVK